MLPFLFLWDVDGTLLRTHGIGMGAMARASCRLFGAAFTWDGIDAAGGLDPLLFAEATTRNGVADAHQHHQSFHDYYIEELRAELERRRHQVELLPGILAALALLRQREAERGDVVLGLLTGNYAKATPLKLAAAGIDLAWFGITAMGDEAPSRPDLVALALRKYAARFGAAAAPRRVAVIGDTPRDIACAHADGARSVAVATGPFGIEELHAADAVARNASELLALLS